MNRAYGSAQHPIALAVMLCMIMPILIYLAKYAVWPRNPLNRRIVYGIGTMIVFGGILAAISRTAVVVMGVMFLITLLLRPKIALLLVALVAAAARPGDGGHTRASRLDAAVVPRRRHRSSPRSTHQQECAAPVDSPIWSPP